MVQKPFDVRCGKFAVLADPDGNELPIIDQQNSVINPDMISSHAQKHDVFNIVKREILK